MDSLTATVLAAQNLGISYGAYVAAHGVVQPKAQPQADSAARICPECGKEFTPVGRHIRAVYCSDECRYLRNRKIALKRYHESKNVKKEADKQ